MHLIPYIICKDAARAVDFYKAAFGAVEDFRMTDPGDGRIGHVELTIGGARLMMADEYPEAGVISPDTLGGTPVTLHLSVEAVDEIAARAADAGATTLRPPQDQSFGERNALVQDPFGHRWMLSQSIEDVSPAEMQRRWEEDTSA
ncbi:VOC family protein [Rhodobacterales bacterium HKCCE2091]|nr:VOC family protein [Rhodobacterales bacterium HKCCE2091]